MIEATVGDEVSRGDVILRILYREPPRLQAALPLLNSAVRIGDEPPERVPFIIDEVM